jgi:hypothetical protein
VRRFVRFQALIVSPGILQGLPRRGLFALTLHRFRANSAAPQLGDFGARGV